MAFVRILFNVQAFSIQCNGLCGSQPRPFARLRRSKAHRGGLTKPNAYAQARSASLDTPGGKVFAADPHGKAILDHDVQA